MSYLKRPHHVILEGDRCGECKKFLSGKGEEVEEFFINVFHFVSLDSPGKYVGSYYISICMDCFGKWKDQIKSNNRRKIKAWIKSIIYLCISFFIIGFMVNYMNSTKIPNFSLWALVLIPVSFVALYFVFVKGFSKIPQRLTENKLAENIVRKNYSWGMSHYEYKCAKKKTKIGKNSGKYYRKYLDPDTN